MRLISSLLHLLAAFVCEVYGSMSWASLPQSPCIEFEEIRIALPNNKVTDFEKDLGRNFNFTMTYENTQGDQRFGLTVDWMNSAIDMWRGSFSWREAEASMNRHPHFTANITSDQGDELQVHFMALFSQQVDATPIALFHGWPGSFLEFMSVLDVVKERYSPETSPYHVVVPSLPGFTLSSGPPVGADWKLSNTTAIMDKLMRGIGFETGYVAHGGDIGSFVAQNLAATSDSCKAIHLNFMPSIPPDSVPPPQNDTLLTTQDRQILARSQEFIDTGQAYALEQGTRPATLGFVLSSHPFSLLAWLAEKFTAWTGPSTRLGVEEILAHVTLYQLTDTISRSFYSYRETSYSTSPDMVTAPQITKPFGYSRFPYDNSGLPESWARATGNLVFFKDHEKGGHFAAMEQPDEVWNDVEEFIEIALPNRMLHQ